ncbi:MAG: tetratricopeptide repeat protein [Caulobacteraceae bacterium]
MGDGSMPFRRPVSIWIKVFLLLMAAILIYSLVGLPSVFKAGIASERGVQAQKAKRYSTAIQEYESVLGRYPDSPNIVAGLAVSYFHNERISESSKLLGEIAGREVSPGLAKEVNSIIKQLDTVYFESNELKEALKLYGQEELEKTSEKLEAYLVKHRNNALGTFYLANIYFDMGKYKEAGNYYNKALSLQPDFNSALLNLSAVYRETGDYEKAIECCNKVLERNIEHPQAYVALAKLEFKRHQDAAGLEYAEKAYKYDSRDMSVAANLCLAYYYNNMTAERDELFDILKKKNYYDMTTLESVFRGELKLR